MSDRTLKALSLILSYPTAELQQAMPEIEAVLAADNRMTAITPRALLERPDDLTTDDIYGIEAANVMQFDRSRSLS
ncbi:MAG: nitrate reductase molybdenum cofactor assembly chaperone, partial [Planctomycetota bacterium]